VVLSAEEMPLSAATLTWKTCRPLWPACTVKNILVWETRKLWLGTWDSCYI